MLRRKGLAEPVYCVLSNELLHMEVVLGHVDIRVADDALNGGKVNAQGLHLRRISMAAAVGRQKRSFGNGFLLKYLYLRLPSSW